MLYLALHTNHVSNQPDWSLRCLAIRKRGSKIGLVATRGLPQYAALTTRHSHMGPETVIACKKSDTSKTELEFVGSSVENCTSAQVFGVDSNHWFQSATMLKNG